MHLVVARAVVSLTPAVFHLPREVEDVAKTYGDDPIVPRGPRFAPILADVRRGIAEALGTQAYDVVVLTGSGSTAMAAVLGSCLAPNEKLLVARNGAYGDRLVEFARTIGQPVVDFESPYGQRPNLAGIEEACRTGACDAIAVVYGGTSTCTLNPLPEIGAIAKRWGKKLLVDGVSALFVEPMDLEAWGVAAVMGSCNKGLHAHPNLTTCLVRKDLMAEMATIAPRAPSLELYKIAKAQDGGSHPYTIDTMSLLQVKAALGVLSREGGVAGRNAIYRARCEILRAGYERLGLTIARFEDMPLCSIGTALEIPAARGYQELADRLATEPFEGHTFEIYSAQGKLSSRLFRVFHMGDYPLEIYDVFLRALARVLS